MKKMENTKDKNVLRKIFKVIEVFVMLIVFFICAVVIVQRLSNNESAFLGYRIFRIETGSMIPKYNIADVILVKETDISTIDIGTDLVYVGEKNETKGRVVTHQVIRKEVDEDGSQIFYTKGIANNKEDPAVYERQVIGTVQRKIYSLTLIMNLILNRYTMYFIIILPLTIYIFFMEMYGKEKKIRDKIKVRNKKAQEKAEKELKKQQEKNSRRNVQINTQRKSQARLGTKDIKRLGTKETQKVEKVESKEIVKNESKETKKVEKKETKSKRK